MRVYASLCDIGYLPRLLALYHSLVKHSSVPFRLYVLPLDDECESILRAMELPGIIVLDQRAFEHDQRMSEIKKQRTRQEYAWTCASNVAEWLLLCSDCEMEEINYLDADTIMYADPEVIFDEIGDRSIGITPHRLIPSRKHLEATNGRFNVGFVHFKNDLSGRDCCSWWAQQCRERCSAKVGCGDQLYLDSFHENYGDRVCEIENIGVNAGPWSIGNWNVTEGPRMGGIQLVLYHAHEFLQKPDGSYRLTNYRLRNEDKRIIYAPYIEAYEQAKKQIESVKVTSATL